MTMLDGKVMYSDDNHLSIEGAERLSKEIFKP